MGILTKAAKKAAQNAAKVTLNIGLDVKDGKRLSTYRGSQAD